MRPLTRRDWMRLTLAGAAAGPLAAGPTRAQQAPAASSIAAPTGPMQTKAIPSSGQRLPVIGLGSSATFSQVARQEDVSALREVLQTLLQHGGTLFDTAPGYGASEAVAGRIAIDDGLAERLFWATKLNVARQGGPADPIAARAQLETSFQRIGRKTIDLIQVHNMGDIRTQLPLLREFKAEGRVRYIGVTTTFERQYPELIDTMKREQLDFIGIDYAIDNRQVEQTILPLARDRGMAVLAYAPFGRTRLFKRVGDRPLPDWAGEFDATTWAQFFLKFVVSHPAITATTPATSRARNMIDNLGGGRGRLPDAALRRRMIETIDGLPAAG